MSKFNKKKAAATATTATKKVGKKAGKKDAFGGGGSIFSPINDVEGKERRGVRITPGDYLLEIKALRAGPSKKEAGVNFFAAEFDVVESDGEEALDPGVPCAWATLLKGTYAFRDVKNLLAAAMAMDEDEVTEAQATEAVEDDGAALVGERVICYATRNSKGYVDLFFEAEE